MLDNQTNNGQHKYAYTYDYVGNRLEMTVTSPGGVGIHLYSYDNIYQITEVNYPDSLSYLATDTEFNYDAAGNRTSVIDGSGTCNYTSNNLNQYTAAGPTNFSYDSSGNMTHDANYGYAYDPENRLIQVTKSGGSPPDALAEALDSGLSFTTGGDSGGWTTEAGAWCYHDWDCASGTTCEGGQDWMQTTVSGAGTLKFWWKVSSESMSDELEFYLDDQHQHSISGEQAWAEKTYTISGAGTHTLRWRYAKSGTGSAGEDRAWVDYVQWTGAMEEPDPNDWSTLNYVYDPAGRRVEKTYDGRTVLKYVYDGSHCIAEYDAGGNLKRKYIYGPGVDQPICMIEAPQTDPNYYYYHFDGMGNVVALTDDEGDTVQVYEYDVYGRVGILDASHPNRFMFTGREYDKETGLYYYRARYYNPQIGRFLQTDPVGYAAGMNLYRYCGNNALIRTDPTGMAWVPTGRFVVMYGAFGHPGVVGALADLGDLLGMIPDLVGPVLNEISSRLSAWSRTMSTSHNYYGYFEVVNTDPPYTTKWVEVVGVLDPWIPEPWRKDQMYVAGAGYNSPFVALWNAMLAASFWPNAVPEEYMDDEFSSLLGSDGYGSEYMSFKNSMFLFDARGVASWILGIIIQVVNGALDPSVLADLGAAELAEKLTYLGSGVFYHDDYGYMDDQGNLIPGPEFGPNPG